MRSRKEKEQAIQLRKQGKSYNQIMELISVSKSTLSGWLWNIELNPEQKEALSSRSRIQGLNGGKAHRDIWEERRSEIKTKYEPPIDNPGFMLGLGLYWGEGAKYSPCIVSLANSDPEIAIRFMSWIKMFFAGEFERFTVCIHHYQRDNDLEIKEYWKGKLGVSDDDFIKSQFQASRSSQHKKGQTLPWGTAHIAVRGKGVWKIRQKIEKAMEIMSAS